MAYGQFFALYSLSITVAVTIGLYVMVGPLRPLLRPTVAFLRRNYSYIVILSALPFSVQVLSLVKTNLLAEHMSEASIENGRLVYALGGNLIKGLQDSLGSGLIVISLEATYMWVFAFFTFFLPILLIVRRDDRALSMFTVAVAINYVVLLSAYILFPVKVSSGLPGTDVRPVLYSSHTWGAMATSVDSLTNCFPSGHVSLSFTSFFIVALVGREYRPLAYLLGATAITLTFAVLTLGIHYPVDVAGGLVLAAVATACAANERSREAILRFARRLARVRVPSRNLVQ